MQLGVIGLGRMGSSMVRRLLRAGHQCVVYDERGTAVDALVNDGAIGAGSWAQLVVALPVPRCLWLMIPAGAVDSALQALTPLLSAGDTVIDGGNSNYRDDIRRAQQCRPLGLHWVDVGTSGGVAGFERGYCLMIGGDAEVVGGLDSLWAALSPGTSGVAPTPGRPPGQGTADQGYLHCGPHGAGHFVKMVHNGIEYGLMAAYAEGFNLLRHAGAGGRGVAQDAETAPLREPELYRFEMDVAQIAEVWRRGSVVGSWLLDLAASALLAQPELHSYAGRVADSGECRWALQAALDVGVPTPVLGAALNERFASRGLGDFANRVLSAMRHEFGGHVEPPAG